MSGFSAEWLALREPFDTAARSADLVTELRAHLPRDTLLDVTDLGAGAGSNLRYLAPRLGGQQRWRLVDHDHVLLGAARARTQAWAVGRGEEISAADAALHVRGATFACETYCERVDLADLVAAEFPKEGLVTAAALLDLVSRAWLDMLARRCRDAHAAVAFALTYDGRTTLTPAEPEDTTVLELFNRHQLSDKGFGPAVGSRAAGTAAEALAIHGYHVRTATSDWLVGPQEQAMQLALLTGWIEAALEVAPESGQALTSWLERRRSHVLAGQLQIRVGHVDLVGWL